MKNAALWSLLILSDTSAQLLMKLGAVHAARAGWVPNAFIVGGYALYGLSFVVWMQLLKETRLFIALSSASVVYVTVAFASALVLGEPVTRQVLAGTILVSAGVFLIAFGGQKEKQPPSLPQPLEDPSVSASSVDPTERQRAAHR